MLGVVAAEAAACRSCIGTDDEACFACHSTPQASQQQPALCHLLPLPPCRFYGGIKLGAGGLVRAYGGAARDCLRAAPKRQMTPQVQLQLQVGAADVARVAACSLYSLGLHRERWPSRAAVRVPSCT